MPRMRRSDMIRKAIILFTTVCCVLSLLLWANSYLHFWHLPDANEPRPFGPLWVVPDRTIPHPMLVRPTFRRSGIALEKGSVLLLPPEHPAHYVPKRGKPLVKVGRLYFEASQCIIHLHCQLYTARVPLWLPTILLAACPTLAFIGGPFRRHRRRRRGECIGCGYDLTGNESGVCPECGEAT